MSDINIHTVETPERALFRTAFDKFFTGKKGYTVFLEEYEARPSYSATEVIEWHLQSIILADILYRLRGEIDALRERYPTWTLEFATLKAMIFYRSDWKNLILNDSIRPDGSSYSGRAVADITQAVYCRFLSPWSEFNRLLLSAWDAYESVCEIVGVEPEIEEPQLRI